MQLEEGYLVGASGAIYPSLEEAIGAAGSGGTVIVRKSGPIELEPIVIAEGQKLSIHAAAGYHPVFISKDSRTTFLRADSPLCLEGLEFKHPFTDVAAEAAPLLHCGKGPVFLANCRFVRPTRESYWDR
ncbi:MAG: hypothetical protein GY953_29940, partial [bacterium]|nr:hypothetical protein [bacterium]